MGKLKILFLVTAAIAALGITNVNAYNYVGTKKYNFESFDANEMNDEIYGAYQYKDESYKLVLGEKATIEKSDKPTIEAYLLNSEFGVLLKISKEK